MKDNLNRAGAIEAVTKTAVESSAKRANYGYVIAPSGRSIGGFDVNALSGASVAYKCANLPAAKS